VLVDLDEPVGVNGYAGNRAPAQTRERENPVDVEPTPRRVQHHCGGAARPDVDAGSGHDVHAGLRELVRDQLDGP
jgi:hypothetical protein